MDLSAIPPLDLFLDLIETVLVTIFIIYLVIRWFYITPFRNGLRKQRKRDWAGAERDYTKMLERSPRFWQAMHNRAMVRAQNNQLDGLLDEENQVIKRKPRFAGAYLVRAEIHFALQQMEHAAADYQKILSLRAKSQVKSVAYARLAILKIDEYEHSPSSTDSARKTLLDQAQENVDTALRLHRKNEIALITKALIFKTLDDLPGALRVYDEALRIAPYSVSLLTSRSTIYIAQENYAAAIADCDKAIYLSGGNAGAYNNRGYAYALQGNLDQALEDCNQALKLAPKLFYAYSSRAFTYFLMGRLDEALIDFQQALEIAPKHDYAMAGTAITLYALGRIDEAKAQWRALLELNPQYHDPDTLKRKYKSAAAFDEVLHKLVASLEE